MIQGHEKIRLSDENGKNDLFVSVNWKIDDTKTNDCKIIKFEFGDGKEAFIKREYLNAFLFAISKEEDQQKMIPQTLTKVKWYETVVSVKAQKDIRKGENITFPIKLSLPAEKKEVIRAVPKPVHKSSFAI